MPPMASTGANPADPSSNPKPGGEYRLPETFDALAAELAPLTAALSSAQSGEAPASVRFGGQCFKLQRPSAAQLESYGAPQNNTGLEHVFLGMLQGADNAAADIADGDDAAAAAAAAAAALLQQVKRCIFEGPTLLLAPPPGCPLGRICNSTFRSAVVSLGATVRRCDAVERCVIAHRSTAFDCEYLGSPPGSAGFYGDGAGPLRVETGPETGSGRFHTILLPDGTYADAVARLMDTNGHGHDAAEAGGAVGERRMALSYVGVGCRLIKSCITSCRFLGENRVECSDLESVLLGEAACVMRHSTVNEAMLQKSARVGGKGATVVEKSVLFEMASADNGARVTDCVLGPEAHLEAIEATCSWVGPCIGMHHNALLIATLWPEGRGNMACGALVGSNHTGRAPDTWMWAGEGVFVGLGALVKFPQTLIEAPYTLLASGVKVPPQRLQMPFSLIVEPATDPVTCRRPPPLSSSGATASRPIVFCAPRLLPAWVLRYSLYTIVRNERKFQTRTKVLPPGGAVPAVIRDVIVQLCLGARRRTRDALEACRSRFEVRGEDCSDAALGDVALTGAEMPGLGACWCLWRDCLRAKEEYGWLVKVHALRTLLEYLEWRYLAEEGAAPPSMGRGYFDAYLGRVVAPIMLPGPPAAGPEAAAQPYPGAFRAWLWRKVLSVDLEAGEEKWQPAALQQLATLESLETDIFKSALHSKQRDDDKGVQITPLYAEGANLVDPENLDAALAAAHGAAAEAAQRVAAVAARLGQNS